MKLNKKKYLCVVPARAGSVGIKNKNIQKLDGIPLVEHTLKFSKKIEKFFDVIISTDSKKILSLGKKYNFIADELRPNFLSRNNSLTIDVVKYELKRIEKKLKKKYDLVLLLQPTVPYRSLKDIDRSLNKIRSNKYDSVVSIKNVDANHPLRMKIIKNNFLKNFSGKKKENMMPRQNLPKVYLRTGSIYMILRDKLLKFNSLVGEKVYGLEQFDKYTINIDTYFDLLLAKNKKKLFNN